MALSKITYDTKVALNPQPSVADVNKVTDDDMNEIKLVVNTNADKIGDLADLDTTDKSSVVGAINEILGKEVYSTNEVKTNKVWIDGKPIYRKVNRFLNYQLVNSANNLSTGISNMESIISSNFYMKFNNVWFIDWADNGFINQTYENNGATYKVYCSQTLTVQELILISEYTKTTD